MLPLSVCEGRLLGWVRTSLGLCAVSMLAPEEGRRVCLASLTLGPALLALIQPVRDDATVVARLRAAATPIELVSALQHVADSLAQEAITITCSSDSSVTDEISRLGWSRIASINQQLTRVCVTCLDEAHRVHELELTLSEDYPRTPPSLLADLPLPLALPRWTALQDIRYAVTEFEYALHKYQAYLNAMDALAADTWVLEPQTLPSYAISQRRLAIDESTSVVIDVNPDTPSAVCKVKVLGPVDLTTALKATYNSNMHLWDGEASIKTNLETLLGIVLPVRSALGSESLAIECAVCYCYYLDNEDSGKSSAPDFFCPNAKCRRPFHTGCLTGWLQAVPSTKTSFGTLFGVCPYCQSSIAVKLPLH